MGFTHPFVISPFQGFYFLDLLAVKTSQWREFRFNKNYLEMEALKVRNILAMGAAHRNYRNPLAQALKGRNKLNKKMIPPFQGFHFHSINSGWASPIPLLSRPFRAFFS
jgi:hypothetical protein